MNENVSVANPVPTLRIASTHKSQFNVVVLINGMLDGSCLLLCHHTRHILLNVGTGTWIYICNAHASPESALRILL